jgi:Zn-dependent metalloprotease
VIAITLRQRTTHETAANADWVLARGAIGWLTGTDVVASKPKGGLRSLSNPGAAYDDPILGKDRQPAHMNKYVKLPNTLKGDFGGVHINAGIPNKAFYEAAQKVGTERALSIWLTALAEFQGKKGPSFAEMADATVASARSEERERVRQAWEMVGVPVNPKQYETPAPAAQQAL